MKRKWLEKLHYEVCAKQVDLTVEANISGFPVVPNVCFIILLS